MANQLWRLNSSNSKSYHKIIFEASGPRIFVPVHHTSLTFLLKLGWTWSVSHQDYIVNIIKSQEVLVVVIYLQLWWLRAKTPPAFIIRLSPIPGICSPRLSYSIVRHHLLLSVFLISAGRLPPDIASIRTLNCLICWRWRTFRIHFHRGSLLWHYSIV